MHWSACRNLQTRRRRDRGHRDGETDLILALGGDGTMLRALRATLGRPTPVFGVRYGRSASSRARRATSSTPRSSVCSPATSGSSSCARSPPISRARRTPRSTTSSSRAPSPDAWSSSAGRSRGEVLGEQRCDGVICCTPTGSTAYNLSNGGPVMMWGLDAMAMTFVAPHSLHARPLVVPRGLDLRITNRTADRRVSRRPSRCRRARAKSVERRPRPGRAGDPARGDVLHPLPRRLCRGAPVASLLLPRAADVLPTSIPRRSSS